MRCSAWNFSGTRDLQKGLVDWRREGVCKLPILSEALFILEMYIGKVRAQGRNVDAGTVGVDFGWFRFVDAGRFLGGGWRKQEMWSAAVGMRTVHMARLFHDLCGNRAWLAPFFSF